MRLAYVKLILKKEKSDELHPFADKKESSLFFSVSANYPRRSFAKLQFAMIFCTFFLIGTFVASVNTCLHVLSVDISNGERLPNGTVVANGVVYEPHHQIQINDTIRGCICELKNCLRKCCPIGQAVISKTCGSYDEDFFPTVHENSSPVDVGSDHFHFIISRECQSVEFFKLNPNDDEFYVQKDGKLYFPPEEVIPVHEYCVDVFVDDNKTNYVAALVCYPDTIPEDKGLYAYGMIISMPFLLLTFLVYAILPDRNLHGKCLMCYVITLFGAYALLIFIQLYPNSIEMDACKALGIMCLFFFMVSFFWMSVMSIDIFLAFSGRRGFSGSRKEAERKRFLLYSAYAWGMPLLLVVVVTSLSVTTDVEANTWYNPGMGAGQCWLRDGIPTLLYFYLPMALLIIINILLFCTTACKIKQVKQDTAVLRKDESKKHSYENDKQRFNLYLKLLLAMGVNWSMEIISWIVDWQIGHVPPAVWYITDFCNALYGVFVFFIFVFKRNIWKLLKKRYYMTIGKPIMARNLTSAYSPRTTASSLNHTITTDKNFANDSSVLTSEVA